jgi:hypothetical protein
MADNVAITQGAGTIIATDDIAGIHHQIVKVSLGPEGSATPLDFGVKANAQSLSVTPSSDHSPFKTKPVTSAHDVAVPLTRPANQTPYTASDVVGAAMTFAGVGANGESIVVTGAQFELDISATPSGMTSFKLALYSATPPSAIADNAAFDLAVADRTVFLGIIDLGTPVKWGNTCYVEANNLNKQVKLATSSIFAYLITSGTYTPAANSEVYKVTLHTIEI